MSWRNEIEEIRRREELAKKMGGEERIQRQHDNGRLTVRERIDALVDPGSFHEIGALAGRANYDGQSELKDFTPSNFVLGTADIDGRRVVAGDRCHGHQQADRPDRSGGSAAGVPGAAGLAGNDRCHCLSARRCRPVHVR